MTDIVASLAVEIGADITGWNAGLSQVQNGIGGLGANVKNLGSKITGLGSQMTVAFAPLTAALGGGIKIAADFEVVMAEIGARAGLTAAEMADVSAFALQMGADTSFSGQQAAEGLLQLLTSGQTVEQAMATLPAVMTAAAASGEDLGMTADRVTDIMAAFGLDVEDAQGVVDSLARAAGASSADIGSLGEGFSNVGPVARRMGLTVDKTSAILAILAENGIKGAEAGTALKSMLLNMTRPTEDAQAAWNKLGTSFYDANGVMRPLPDVLADINLGLADKTPQEANEILQDLFGSYGIVAGSALLSSMSIEEMTAMMEMQASAAEVADARLDTFAGRVETLKGSIETLMITALTPLLNNVLKPLAEKLTDVVNGVTTWANKNPELASAVTGVLAGLAILGPVLVGFGLAVSLAGTAITGIGIALGLLLSPIVLMGVGVALLAVAWATNWNGIQEKTEGVLGAIQTAITNVGLPALDTFKQKVTGIFTSIKDTNIDTAQITTWAQDNMNGILDVVVTVAGIVLGGPIGAVIGAAKLISSAIENDFLGFGTFIQESGIQESITAGVSALRDILTTAFQQLTGPSGGMNADAALAESFAMGEGVQATGQSNPILDAISGIVDGIKRGVEAFSPELQEGLQQIASGIKGFIDGLAGADTSGLDNIFATILNIAGIIGGIAGTLIAVGFDIITDLFENVFPKIGEGISGLITIVSGLGEGDPGLILQGIATAVTSIVGAFTGAVEGFADPLISALEDILGIDLGVWVQEHIVTPIEGIADSIKQGLEDFKEALRVPLKWIEDNVLKPFKQMIDDIVGAINSLTGFDPNSQAWDPLTAPTTGGAAIQPRAMGGPVMAGHTYLVGENGPELFRTGRSGTIIPNGGGGGMIINVYGESPHELARMIESAMHERDR